MSEEPKPRAKKVHRRPKLEPGTPRAQAVHDRMTATVKGSDVTFMPSSVRKTYLRAVNSEGGARLAVKAFCLMCTSYERIAVANCTSLACPLWGHRPFQSKLNKLKPEEFDIPEID